MKDHQIFGKREIPKCVNKQLTMGQTVKRKRKALNSELLLREI